MRLFHCGQAGTYGPLQECLSGSELRHAYAHILRRTDRRYEKRT